MTEIYVVQKRNKRSNEQMYSGPILGTAIDRVMESEEYYSHKGVGQMDGFFVLDKKRKRHYMTIFEFNSLDRDRHNQRVLKYLNGFSSAGGDGTEAKRPGRKRLGTLGKEVMLMPEHWEWLRAQDSGISGTLRGLVEAAIKAQPKPKGAQKPSRFTASL